MNRQTVVGQIYGYGVSLLGVLIILASIHGIVSGIFRVINPAAAAHPPMMVWRMHGGPGMGMGGPGMMGGGNFGYHRMRGGAGAGGAMGTTNPAPQASPGDETGPGMMGPGAMNPENMHASMMGNARYAAIERLVVAIIFLIVGIALFQRTWSWLHESSP